LTEKAEAQRQKEKLMLVVGSLRALLPISTLTLRRITFNTYVTLKYRFVYASPNQVIYQVIKFNAYAYEPTGNSSKF